ncbi:hypothetical protein [Nocardia sp. 348MFTsu5.1]|uniref:hypothetical protein n=1 Tax=Nocardia sp. 348MFTsu5.1 TaxID=1172185 RepID=UPI00036AEAC4|nr:hypothetical protein [Nocardia sp. 348MFTsu5.1]
MSAELVDPEHIHVLVTAGLPRRGDVLHWRTDDTTEPTPLNGLFRSGPDRRRALRPETANAVGQMLVDANAASMNRAYNEDNAYIYDYRRPRRAWDPVELFKAIDGYEYQACEVDDWETSEAHRYCASLRETLIARLPGYSEATTWLITPHTISLYQARGRQQ